MEQFRTTINIDPSKDKITYNANVLFIGSCFTENIGNKFLDLKMPSDVNPFGIIFNPISIYNSLDFLIQKKIFTKEDLRFHNEHWFSFHHHGRFSNANALQCLHAINNQIAISSNFLNQADYIFITFGTAVVYKNNETNEVVANCHKIPANEFTSHILSVSEIVDLYKKLLINISKVNSGAKIIFTLSPVRHWKDGAEKNQLSKATLLLAIHELKNLFNNITYFPAYEIMMDDLRDYRFYADDMLHPGAVAIDYIWKIFGDVFFDSETKNIQKEMAQFNKALHHRPFNENSEQHKKFQLKTLDFMQQFSEKYPHIKMH